MENKTEKNNNDCASKRIRQTYKFDNALQKQSQNSQTSKTPPDLCKSKHTNQAPKLSSDLHKSNGKQNTTKLNNTKNG